MKRLVEFVSQSGEIIYVEVDEPQFGDGVTRRGISPIAGTVERAKLTFEEALDKAQPVAEALVNKLRSLEPDEATIEFGMTLSAEAGAILAAASSSAHYKVTLQWRKDPRKVSSKSEESRLSEEQG